MAMAAGWAYYYHIRLTSDHMDTLRLYNGYKHYWDKHRIPGEMVRNEQLWEDPWWKQKKLMNLQTRGGTRSLPPLRSRKLKRKGPASAASANSSSTIRTSKSLPAKMAAITPPEIETRQNGTQTDRMLAPNTLAKPLEADALNTESSLPLIPPTTPNNSEKLSDTASVSSLTDTKLPPVVNKDGTV